MHPNTNTTAYEQENQALASASIGVPHPWRDLLQPMCLSQEAREGADDKGATETERILFALAQAVEQRDRYTANHCGRLAFISVAMGIFMGLDRGNLLSLYRGGYLHDIGKVGIPDSILFKPDKLNEEEWAVMRTHTIRGVDICRHLKSLAPVMPIIRYHHERWDGSGYPHGLRGEEIPLLARVLQTADIYDALTSPRPYKEAYSAAKALRRSRLAGSGGGGTLFRAAPRRHLKGCGLHCRQRPQSGSHARRLVPPATAIVGGVRKSLQAGRGHAEHTTSQVG